MTNGSKLDAFIQEIDVSGWDNLPPDKRLEILQRFENVMAESEQRDALKINVISEEEYRTDKRNPGKRSESSAGKGKKNLSGEKSQRKSFVCKKGNAFPGRSDSRRK